ncbi:MAG: hypothetical protein JWM12_3134 [Ilumatobacteraceae bacterium]|nr:hypothetical protein [Ilumatobacteraceae bacterium]
MGTLLLDVAILGLLSGLDPLAFLAVLVVSAQQRRNGIAFLCGWLLVLVVLSVAPATVLHSRPEHEHVTHRQLRAVLLLVFGLVLIGLAVRSRYAGRHHDAEKIPRWYLRLQRVGLKTSFLTGAVLPSFPAAIAAGTAVFRADIMVGGRILALTVFVLVSSAIVIAPPALLYLAPETAPVTLARINARVYRERHDITFWVLSAIGLFLVARSGVRLL